MKRNKCLIRIFTVVSVLFFCAPSLLAQDIKPIILKNEYILSGEIIDLYPIPSYIKLTSKGNLVVYRGTTDDPEDILWASKSYGEEGLYYAAVQGDGNLIIRKGDPHTPGETLWASGSNSTSDDYFLGMNNDLCLCIYRGTGPKNIKAEVWNYKTGSSELVKKYQENKYKKAEEMKKTSSNKPENKSGLKNNLG